LAALALGFGSAAAALDPQLDKPYSLQVVLDVADQRILTRTFVAQVQRDLQDLLQADLGALARVKVVRKHPLLARVRAAGLEKAWHDFHEVSDTKIHVVRIDYAGGGYDIQARQYDGLTGLAGPRVHHDRTADRQLVARTAALLVSRDFGPVGTVTEVDGDIAKVALKGVGLGVPLKRWVNVNDVFAVVQVSKGSAGLRSTPFRWALLQVTRAPHDGVCLCRYYHRFEDDKLTDQPQNLGYRCLRLSTVRAPLRIRFLDYQTHTPLEGLQVHVGASGFKGNEPVKKFATNDKGLLPRTEDTYANVAFVRVVSGGEVRARIPVAMLGDRTLDCLVSVQAGDEERAQKLLRRDRWLRRIYDELRVAADRVGALNEMGKQSLRERALTKARAGLQSLKAELQSLREERNGLRREDGLDLAEGEQRLAELEKRRQELERFVTRLDQIVKEEKDPRKQEMLGMIERARLLETQAEFGQAIDLYGKVLDMDPRQTKVREERRRLEQAWAVKDDAHRKARIYIYETWPKLQNPQELEKGLAQVRQAFAVCRMKGDILSPLKILRANVVHSDNLTKRLAALRPQAREDDRKEAKVIAQVAEGVKKLHEDVTAYLKTATSKAP
jgi:hypothetical protein